MPEHVFLLGVGGGEDGGGLAGGEGLWMVTKVMFTRHVGTVIGSVPETSPTAESIFSGFNVTDSIMRMLSETFPQAYKNVTCTRCCKYTAKKENHVQLR